MKVLVVGDGQRDSIALPNLIRAILGDANIETEFNDAHIRVAREKGTVHARKVKYFTRRAQADQFDALAIVVDTDRAPPREKLRQLRQGRDEDRQRAAPFPTAVGEANPHFEVWLLDDPVAVREAWQLPTACEIATPAKSAYPKDTLNKLRDLCVMDFDSESAALGAIAHRLKIERCVHGRETGFDIFVEEVTDELRPKQPPSS